MISSPLIKTIDISDNINRDADFFQGVLTMIDEKKLNSIIEYAWRFGQIAVLKGFITEQQLEDALDNQINHNLINDNHKLIGEILFEKRWMTQDQIAIVLENMSKIKMCSSSYLTYYHK